MTGGRVTGVVREGHALTELQIKLKQPGPPKQAPRVCPWF